LRNSTQYATKPDKNEDYEDRATQAKPVYFSGNKCGVGIKCARWNENSQKFTHTFFNVPRHFSMLRIRLE